jgi:hypothetical protein
LQKGAKTEMSTKEWKNRELPTLLTEKWGFSFNLLTESQEEEVIEEETDERFMPPECRRGGAEEGSQKCIDAAVMAQGLYAESEEIEEGAASSGRELTADREQNDDRRSSQKRARPMEEGELPQGLKDYQEKKKGGESKEDSKKGKYDDGDGKDEKCDHVPCKDQDKKEKMDEAQIRQIIRKLVKEAMNKKEAK